MKIGIMQPYFMPYIGYFQLLATVDKFVIYDDVNYINRGWINRNRILVNGKDHMITIPLQNASQNKLICDINLIDGEWRSKLLKTIYHSYSKSPFFKTGYELACDIINHRSNDLSSFLYNSLVLISNYLNIKTEIVKTSRVYKNNNFKGEDRIIDICRLENATSYVNAIGGISLYERDAFERCGIALLFHNSHPLSYCQFENEFVPWLSIIDVIMFNDPRAVSQMLLDGFLQ